MERELTPHVLRDMERKIVLISGARQTGKTTLAKSLAASYEYFNHDEPSHRLILREKSWDRRKPLVIFDELHKMPEWKTFLKAVYDVDGVPPAVVVTGSARLDAFRKVGDSLAGRFFSYRLHPVDVREATVQFEPPDALSRILAIGGFPEPFLVNDPVFYARWKRSHLDVILRQDLLDLVTVTDIASIETLIELLKSRVGSTVSYANLARDLEKDAKTIKSWLVLLENLYVVFPVRPWSRNVGRAILKEPKYYFYDTGQVRDEGGRRLENAVACALKKRIDFLEDTTGTYCTLHYLRTKDGRELDFAVARDDRLSHAFEVKTSVESRSASFDFFSEAVHDCRKVQVVLRPGREKTYPDGVEIRDAATFLATLDLAT